MHHDRTSDILIKTPFRYILEAKQPVVDICHDKISHVPLHMSLSVSTIPKKPYYIFMLYFHQAYNLLVKSFFIHENVSQPLHGDRLSAKYSLTLRCVSVGMSFEIKRD
jgi:hypothetical protein